MKQAYFLNRTVAGTPKIFVSTKVWKIQVILPFGFSLMNKNENAKEIGRASCRERV